MQPYKLQMVQELLTADFQKRVAFAQSQIAKIALDLVFFIKFYLLQ